MYQQKPDQGGSEGDGQLAAGAVQHDGESDGGHRADAAGQQVEAVDEIDPVDHEQGHGYDEDGTGHSGQMDGHGGGHRPADGQLPGQAYDRWQPGAVVGHAEGGGEYEGDEDGGPPGGGAHRRTAQNGHPSEVGDGGRLELERTRAVDDAEPPGGGHDQRGDDEGRDQCDHADDRGAHGLRPSVGCRSHCMRSDSVPACSWKRAASPKPARR